MADAHQTPETPIRAGTPQVQAAADSTRTEAEVRAIRARRHQMEASYRAEGFSEAYIATHVTDAAAERLLGYERQTFGLIASLFGARA